MDPSSLRAAELYDLLFLFAKKAQIMHKQINLLDASLHAYYTRKTCSVRPKPLFWFRCNTETQILTGHYFLTDTVTHTVTTFQRENLVTNTLSPTSVVPTDQKRTVYF